eukprot:7523958-Pyramimonas_sp.AAC.1
MLGTPASGGAGGAYPPQLRLPVAPVAHPPQPVARATDTWPNGNTGQKVVLLLSLRATRDQMCARLEGT